MQIDDYFKQEKMVEVIILIFFLIFVSVRLFLLDDVTLRTPEIVTNLLMNSSRASLLVDMFVRGQSVKELVPLQQSRP